MTAVEQLIDQLTSVGVLEIPKGSNVVTYIIEQAKEMEKEQHQETFKQSRSANIFEKDMPPVWESFEQYYNETFKSE